MSKQIAVIGAGSWGTALAKLLALNGNTVRMWDLDTKHLEEMQANRENVRYLPGVKLPDAVEICMEERACLKNADIVLFGVPAQHFRTAFQIALALMPEDVLVVNVAKGIEQASLQRMSEVAYSIKPAVKYVVLSGKMKLR